ncbi:preprotein translocase subunit SecY [Candidatus Dojkabacteria bacterium HGW-Dojkabacteria-1]|uniref:Protein translocase subunit SecY n=1 Tax=Candidatus Dojkabacteria bacterium HGW-Dojkabacteria-1 TaxID=2013761 RepID=A0A2N2F323_9BACT|nr:MAG: preprotein translocase subunit SecY [Candidatus Dojkabacteria bacterium HGW-Dojkabacteria-1]
MNKYIEVFRRILRTEEIRKKIIFSLTILLAYRFLAAIPVVGIPADAIKLLFEGSSFGDLLSTVSGGVLETASIAAIGLSPYINASIIFQLLGSVIPKIEEIKKEGPEGRRRISMYTRLLTVPLAIMQSFVIYSTLRGFGLIGQLEPLHLMVMVATLTAGSILVMWFAELTSESGVGGGSSYLIFLGIIAGIPGTLRSNFTIMDPLQKIVFIVITLLLIISVVYITEAQRRVKVQYSRRVRAGGAMDSYIPIKLVQFGVMPVIFAVSLLSFPQLIGKFILSRDMSDGIIDFTTKAMNLLDNPYFNNTFTFLLIVGFAFFYLTVVFKTDDLAENLQKQGGFIPGIRPGKNTSEYLRKVAFRLASVGALFLGLISILPNIFISIGLMTAAVITGTGLLIMVNVVLDIRRQVASMIVVRDYDRYL